MKHPLISVIVPVYKVEPYLNKCVNSLLAQTYENLEIILVDDGSPDSCPQMCDEFARNNPNVSVIHKENGGLSLARNLGVEKCMGEFVAFVDSDDYVEPRYISDMWDMLNGYNADLAVTRVQREYENEKREVAPYTFDSPLLTGEEALFATYFTQRLGWHSVGKLYRKELLLHNPFPVGYYEDFAVIYKILLSCDRVAVGDYIDNYHYVCRENSILNQKLTEKHYRIFDVCKEMCDFLAARFPEEKAFPVVLYKSAVVQLLNVTSVDKESYRKLFKEYKPFFKQGYKLIRNDGRLSTKDRMIVRLLGTSPAVYKFAMWLNKIRKG